MVTGVYARSAHKSGRARSAAPSDSTSRISRIIASMPVSCASAIVTMCRSGDSAQRIATTSGRAIPGVEVRIVDNKQSERPRGDVGEIMVRGYNVMKGYFEEPEATAATITPEGWLHTGDIGTMDEQGYIQITDRKKDMYIMGGFNCYPAEIERLILKHPSIMHAAVILLNL